MTKKETIQLADQLKNDLNNANQFQIDAWNSVRGKLSNKENNSILRSEEKALDFIINMSFHKELKITQDLIRQIHQNLSINKNNEFAGQYRQTQALQTKSKKITPEPKDLPHFMDHFIGQVNTSKSFFHPIEFATYVYKRIFDIQPFDQGNELLADFLISSILINEGYGIIFIQPQKDIRFNNALELAQNYEHPDMEPIIQIVAECVVKDESMFGELVE